MANKYYRKQDELIKRALIFTVFYVLCPERLKNKNLTCVLKIAFYCCIAGIQLLKLR